MIITRVLAGILTKREPAHELTRDLTHDVIHELTPLQLANLRLEYLDRQLEEAKTLADPWERYERCLELAVKMMELSELELTRAADKSPLAKAALTEGRLW